MTIIGRPNVGKSTFLNTLLSQKLSITNLKAQTTRICIKGILSENNFQMIVLDTPGLILDSITYLEKRIMSSLNRAIDHSDCIMALIDASENLRETVPILQSEKAARLPPICVIVNKIDTIPPKERNKYLEYIRKIFHTKNIFECSASKNYGIKEIKTWVLSNLPESPCIYPKEFVASQPDRFFVSEQVRGTILKLYDQEIPYSCQVNVVEFVERIPPRKTFIRIEIWVETNRQKIILLGHKGSMVHKLSTKSRKSIEEFLSRPVYLSVHIKVREGWRKNSEIVAKLGY